MFEGLDRIDWGRLTHAYGPADDVPGRIRELASADAAVRKAGFENLHATICHQGSRYRASAPAVPFLFELLETPGAHDRARLVQLLEGLAIGYPDWHLPLGFDPDAVFAEAEGLGGEAELERIRAAEPDEEEDDGDLALVALWQRDAYRAVLGRLGTIRALTGDADRAVRLHAVRALAWFPAAAAGSVGPVRDIARDHPDPGERANAILCLGLLDRALGDESDVPRLVAEAAPGRPRAARVAAAISLAVILGRSAPAGCVAALLDAMQAPQEPAGEGLPVPWFYLGLVTHASTAFRLVQPAPTEPILASLCRAAEQVRDTGAGADVFWALLGVVIPDPSVIGTDPATGFRRLDPARLTPEQVRALRVIGRAPVWDHEPYYYGRLMDLGLEFGLPWHPAKYRALLEAIPGGGPSD